MRNILVQQNVYISTVIHKVQIDTAQKVHVFIVRLHIFVSFSFDAPLGVAKVVNQNWKTESLTMWTLMGKLRFTRIFRSYSHTYLYAKRAGLNLGWRRWDMLVLFSFFWCPHRRGRSAGVTVLLRRCVPTGAAHGTRVQIVFILRSQPSCVMMASSHNRICLQLYVWSTCC